MPIYDDEGPGKKAAEMTPEDAAQVVELRRGGFKRAEIQRKLNMTEKAVARAARQYDWQRGKWR